MRLPFILCLVFFSATASAGVVKFAHVEREGNEYRLDLSMQVEAGRAGVLTLLTDHDIFMKSVSS